MLWGWAIDWDLVQDLPEWTEGDAGIEVPSQRCHLETGGWSEQRVNQIPNAGSWVHHENHASGSYEMVVSDKIYECSDTIHGSYWSWHSQHYLVGNSWAFYVCWFDWRSWSVHATWGKRVLIDIKKTRRSWSSECLTTCAGGKRLKHNCRICCSCQGNSE